MKRHKYKGYIADTDNLGRVYIYNTRSPYSEESDKIYVRAKIWSQVKQIIETHVLEDEIKKGE